MKMINPIYVFQFGMLTSGVAVIMFGVPSSYVALAVISAFFGVEEGKQHRLQEIFCCSRQWNLRNEPPRLDWLIC